MKQFSLPLILPVLLLAICWSRPLPLAAAEETPAGGPAAVAVESAAAPDSAPEPTLPTASRLTAFHEYFSEQVEVLSWKIDSFFGATRVYEEYSGNYLQMRGSVIYVRGGEFEFDGKVRLKLDLPNLEERINLVFESEEEDQTTESRITTGTPLNRTTDDKNINASLQWVLQQQERWDVRLQPGLKLKLDPEPFVRLRFRWLNPLSQTWLTRTTVTPGWYTTRGWEVKALFDLERGTGAGSLFRSSSEAIWLRDDARDLQLIQSFLFTHPLSDRAQMAYETGVLAEIDPRFQDTGYFASTRYRRDIHQGWIFLELKPQVVFAREDDFNADASFAVTLEMLFGGDFL